MCRLTAGGADGDLGVEDVLAAEYQRRWFEAWRGPLCATDARVRTTWRLSGVISLRLSGVGRRALRAVACAAVSVVWVNLGGRSGQCRVAEL